MDAIEALTSRASMPLLVDPAPSEEQLHHLLQAAARAADHGCLRPWQFLDIRGKQRLALGDLYRRAAAQADPGLSASQLERISTLPLRAPLILVAIARCQHHPKVPEIEQIIAVGAAVQNLLTAAFALGIGAYWRTGSLAYNEEVRRGLTMAMGDKIVGFIYLGTPNGQPRVPKVAEIDQYYRVWQGLSS